MKDTAKGPLNIHFSDFYTKRIPILHESALYTVVKFFHFYCEKEDVSYDWPYDPLLPSERTKGNLS